MNNHVSKTEKNVVSLSHEEVLAVKTAFVKALRDGGGSATLLAVGEVLNRPSDGRPRKVANGLFLTLPGTP